MDNVERVCDLIYRLKMSEYKQILQKWAETIIDEYKATVSESYEDNPKETINRIDHIKDRL